MRALARLILGDQYVSLMVAALGTKRVGLDFEQKLLSLER
jgi:hypothetical protein